MLADDLRARSDLTVDGDQDRVRLLPQEVALEQAIRGRPRADQVTCLQTTLGDDRQRVLVAIRESLALGGEAIVTEPFEEVAVVDLDGGLGAARVVDQAGFESRDIEVDPGIDPDPDGIAIDVQQFVGRDARLGETLPDEPECLAEGSGRSDAGIGPQVGGDRFP